MNKYPELQIIDLEQNSEGWFEWRDTVIGASDGLAAMNHNKRFWNIKTGRIERPYFSTAATRRGHELEPHARFMAEVELGVSLPPVCGQRGITAASMDGINIEAGEGLEIKCPSNVEVHKKHLAGKISKAYLHQMQQQMYVFGLDHMNFISYMPEHDVTHKIIRIERDDDYIAEMVEAHNEFWKRVETDSWPDDGLGALIAAAADAIAIEKEATAQAKAMKADLLKALNESGLKSSDNEGVKVCRVIRKVTDAVLMKGDPDYAKAADVLAEAKAALKPIEDKYKLKEVESLRVTLPKGA